MYISSVKIKNFRNFDNIDIDFHEGVNVLIGHNNWEIKFITCFIFNF